MILVNLQLIYARLNMFTREKLSPNMKLNEVATVLTLLRANSSFRGFFSKCPRVYFDAENLPAKAHVELSRFNAPMPTFSLVLWEG